MGTKNLKATQVNSIRPGLNHSQQSSGTKSGRLERKISSFVAGAQNWQLKKFPRSKNFKACMRLWFHPWPSKIFSLFWLQPLIPIRPIRYCLNIFFLTFKKITKTYFPPFPFFSFFHSLIIRLNTHGEKKIINQRDFSLHPRFYK